MDCPPPCRARHAGNGDAEMPHGGFGREFASADDGDTWAEVGPPHPTDGNPRKGVAFVPQHEKGRDQLTCVPFRLQVAPATPP